MASCLITSVLSFSCLNNPSVITTRSNSLTFSTRKLTSSNSLSLSLSLSKISLHSPPKNPFSPLIFAAKPYKMKTHKASAKRFRVTGSGKIMRRRAGKQHLLRKKNTKRRLRLSKMLQVDRCDYNNVIGCLPYLKVNRQN